MSSSKVAAAARFALVCASLARCAIELALFFNGKTHGPVLKLLRLRAIWRKITCEQVLKLKPMMWEKPHWNWKCYSFLNCSLLLLLLFCAARRSRVLFKDQFELPRSHSHTLTALSSAAARKLVICKLEKKYNHLIAKRRRVDCCC